MKPTGQMESTPRPAKRKSRAIAVWRGERELADLRTALPRTEIKLSVALKTLEQIAACKRKTREKALAESTLGFIRHTLA